MLWVGLLVAGVVVVGVVIFALLTCPGAGTAGLL